MNRKHLFLLAILMSILNLRGCSGVQFEDSSEQKFVIENGTEEVILDCPYTLEDEEEGLVVKWFFEDFNDHFFQWIPGLAKPQAIYFNDFLDLGYEVNDNPLHKHRALRLVKPTLEVHGRYKCRVSTYENEDTHSVNLIVYTLPSALALMVDDTDTGNVSVQCISEPSFPEPDLELSLLVAGESVPLDSVKETMEESGLFNTSVTAYVDGDSIAAAPIVEFQCTLSIPHTSLSIIEGLKYRSDGLPIYDEDGIETTLTEFESENEAEEEDEEDEDDAHDDDDDDEEDDDDNEVHVGASTDRGRVPSSSGLTTSSLTVLLIAALACLAAN